MPEYTVREKYVAEGSVFEMHEGAVIVGRRPHLSGVKLLIAEPEAPTYECGAPTANGECSRTVDGPNDKCWQHS